MSKSLHYCSLAVFRFVESWHTQCPRVIDVTARLSVLHAIHLNMQIKKFPGKPMTRGMLLMNGLVVTMCSKPTMIKGFLSFNLFYCARKVMP